MNNFKRTFVKSFNESFNESNTLALAYRLKQSRFVPQFIDVLVDSGNPDLYMQYFTNWIEKSFSFIPISKYFSVKCLKS